MKIDSHTTSYLEGGRSGADAVIFIHDGAFGTTAELCWGAVMEQLADDFHVLAPELYGWGGSDKHYPFGQSPYPYRIEQVAQWIDRLGIRSAVVVGASFGGSLSLRATMQEGNPWRSRGTISITGAGGLFRPPAAVEALGHYTPSYEEAERLTKLVVKSISGMEDHVQKRYENSLIPGHWECLMAPTLRNPGNRSERPHDEFPERLGEVDVPVLLVEGAHDELLEAGWAERLSRYAPKGDFTVVDASHEPNLDQPGLVVDIIRDFVRNI